MFTALGQFGVQRLSNGKGGSGSARVSSKLVRYQSRVRIRAVLKSSNGRVALESQLH